MWVNRIENTIKSSSPTPLQGCITKALGVWWNPAWITLAGSREGLPDSIPSVPPVLQQHTQTLILTHSGQYQDLIWLFQPQLVGKFTAICECRNAPLAAPDSLSSLPAGLRHWVILYSTHAALLGYWVSILFHWNQNKIIHILEMKFLFPNGCDFF